MWKCFEKLKASYFCFLFHYDLWQDIEDSSLGENPQFMFLCLHCSPLFTLNKQDSVLQQTGQKNAFFLKYNTQLLVASVLSYIYPLK